MVESIKVNTRVENGREEIILTCILRNSPTWLNGVKLWAIVRSKNATFGFFAQVKQRSDNPGPMKPIDYIQKIFSNIKKINIAVRNKRKEILCGNLKFLTFPHDIQIFFIPYGDFEFLTFSCG